MEEKNQNIGKNIKTEFALSAILFFSPFLKNPLQNNQKLSQEDKSFVYWFIKVWYINIFILILSIICEIIYLKTWNELFKKLATIILIILIILISILCWFAISNKSINKNKMTQANNEIFFNFIPIYNIYNRYKKHDFENKNSILKESILLRTIFSIYLIFFQNIIVTFILFFYIIFRIIATVNWIWISEKYSTIMDKLFKKNPEEIRWIISWFILWLFSKDTISEKIENKKKDFEYLFKLDNKQIILEYILFWLIYTFLIYKGINTRNWYLISWLILIWTRYFIMIIKWKHLPHLPILKWITNIFFKNKKNEKWKND